jgi:hypothetical protein
MNINFEQKQQAFHNNSYINPLNGKKLIFGSKQYLRAIKIYGLHDLSNLFLQINQDIISEISQYIDNKTLTSFLLINHHTFQFVKYYQPNIFKYALQRELNYAKGHFLKVGLRVNNGIDNYKITKITKNDATSIKVDLLGHRIDDYFYSLRKNERIWKMGKNEIRFGILLCHHGPPIHSIDDPMLKYHNFDTHPQIGSLALIKIEQKYYNIYYHHESIVKEINNGIIKLCFQNNVFEAAFIKNKWICDNKDIKIIKFYNKS